MSGLHLVNPELQEVTCLQFVLRVAWNRQMIGCDDAQLNGKVETFVPFVWHVSKVDSDLILPWDSSLEHLNLATNGQPYYSKK